jgi:hypothetical protein
MQNQIKSYLYHEHQLSIPASLLYEDWGVMSYRNYLSKCQSKKLVRTRRACKGHEALISYHDLPESLKMLCIEKLGHYKDVMVVNELQNEIRPDVKAKDFFLFHTKPDGSKLDNEDQVIRYNSCLILNAIKSILLDRRQSVKVFGKNRVKIWQNISEAVNTIDFVRWNHNLPKNAQSLQRKYNRYLEEGYSAFIHANEGNKHTAKVHSKEQTAMIEYLLSHHNNLDNQAIADLYNTTANAFEWENISASAVGVWRERLDYITYSGRRGGKEFDNKKAMQHKRKAPSMPLLYWTVDGWDVELLYQKTIINEKGHKVKTFHNRLNAVMVLDPHTKYVVGYAIAEHESPDLIKKALKNALQHTSELFGKVYKPYQLQTDNYQKKKLFDIYEGATKIYTPARVGNAKSKTIEPFFGWFNRKHFQNKLLQNWNGHGITSEKENQPNSEYLNAVRHQFPDKDGCIAQIENAIENDRAEKRAKYLEAWQNMPEDQKIEMQIVDYLRYYGETTGFTNRFTGPGLTPTILGNVITYDSFDVNFRMQAHNDWCVFYDPEDLTRVLAVNAESDKNSRLKKIIGTQQFILESKHIGAMAIADQTEADLLAKSRINEFNKANRKMIIDRQKERNQIVAETLQSSNHKDLDVLKKHLISDSKGQHKDRVIEARKTPKELPAKIIPYDDDDEDYEIIDDILDQL